MTPCVQKETVNEQLPDRTRQFRVPCRAFLSKVTDVGTHTNTSSVDILLWVPNAVPASV